MNDTKIVLITTLVCNAQVIEREKNSSESANKIKVNEYRINSNVFTYLQVLPGVSLHEKDIFKVPFHSVNT